MCTSHDQLHYRVLPREIAAILASDDPRMRDQLLQIATFIGMELIYGENAENLPATWRVRIRARLEAERTRLIKETRDNYIDIRKHWRAQQQADDVPF